ncbi:hypothetical protein HGRIS_010770 [Hohenbuehelia grisea]|uniref:Uncharacterized protein n=1 Tax=Hohenbuehelia grisea TaxID=104357 RepID=A0ABR3IXQ0_9AGAR
MRDPEDLNSYTPLALDKLRLHFSTPSSKESDATAIAWILEACTEPEAVSVAAQMVPFVEWPLDLDLLPAFHQLSSTFIKCFEAKFRESLEAVAVSVGKALLHLYFERRNMGDNLASRLFARDSEIARRLSKIDPDVRTDANVALVSWNKDLYLISQLVSEIIGKKT